MVNEIKRTYRYRIYPNQKQRQELARTFGCSRWVYNWALETKTKVYYKDIAVEDSSGKNMQQNGTLARHIGQAGWNQLVRRLRDKCEWYGRTLVIADKWFSSSQRCSECGHVGGKKPSDMRAWTCSECGEHHDRDINAAKNLSRVGQTRIQAPGQLDKADAFEVVGTAGGDLRSPMQKPFCTRSTKSHASDSPPNRF